MKQEQVHHHLAAAWRKLDFSFCCPLREIFIPWTRVSCAWILLEAAASLVSWRLQVAEIDSLIGRPGFWQERQASAGLKEDLEAASTQQQQLQEQLDRLQPTAAPGVTLHESSTGIRSTCIHTMPAIMASLHVTGPPFQLPHLCS